MKIERVTTELVRLQPPRPLASAGASVSSLDYVIVTLETADGLRGLGYVCIYAGREAGVNERGVRVGRRGVRLGGCGVRLGGCGVRLGRRGVRAEHRGDRADHRGVRFLRHRARRNLG